MGEIKAYREGILTYYAIQKLNCCVPHQGMEERFRYVEVIYTDGTRHFYYTNQREFDYWEENFYRNRYTSFHEFWTTEEKKKSEGAVAFDYYVRRPASDYTRVDDLGEVLEKLKPYRKLSPRMCTYDSYSREVDYGYAEGELL